MTFLNAFQNSARPLANVNSRLSFCPRCCCPNLPTRLYLHVIPTYLNSAGSFNPDCAQVDGPNTDDYRVTAEFPDSLSTHCEDWYTFLVSQDPLPSPQPCWEGARGDSFGIGIHLYCFQTDQFAADICFLPTAHPDFPDLPCPANGFLQGVRPVFENTCNAEPGTFLVDFGNWIPRQGAFDCECSFHIYIDEHPDGGMEEQNPNFYFPAEGIAGISGLEGMNWFFEEYPGVGTPEHPTRRPTVVRILSKCEGVGTRIARRLAKARIKYKNEDGCNCNRLMKAMNAAGPQQILNELDRWTEEMKESANQWFRMQRGIRGWIKKPLRPLALSQVKRWIRKACYQELECLQLPIENTPPALALR